MANDLYITTVRDGNWSRPQHFHDSPWWASDEEAVIGLVPGDGWTVQVRHTLTVDADTIVGGSYQAPIWDPLAVSTTAGSDVTALPTGTYTASAAVFSAKGVSYIGNTVTAGFVLTQGVSKPRITFPQAAPSGCSYYLYLDNPLGSNAGHRNLYCSGITGTTVDLIPDGWGLTWSAGVPAGTSAGYGNVPNALPPGETNAITLNSAGSIVIAPGKKLLIRGDIVAESPSGSTKAFVSIGAGSTFRSDPSQAVDTTRADYLVWFQGGGDIRFLG